jgi:hypothetical protein
MFDVSESSVALAGLRKKKVEVCQLNHEAYRPFYMFLEATSVK